MTDEEKKAWEEMLEVAKRNLSMPITDERFRMAQQVFLSADAELTRLRSHAERCEDVESMTKAIMAKYLDEGFARVDFRENECFLAACAIRDFLKLPLKEALGGTDNGWQG